MRISLRVCGKCLSECHQPFEEVGGPGGTRTPNQTVMSGMLSILQVDYYSYFVLVRIISSRSVHAIALRFRCDENAVAVSLR